MLVLALLPPCSTAGELTLFDWLEIAPTVVSGVVLGQDGKLTELEVERVLRGKVRAGELVLIDLKYVNRTRDYDVDPRPLKLSPGKSYVLLLQVAPFKKSGDRPVYRVVRGTRGARDLPPEGSQAFLDALERFARIQDMGNDRATWRLLGSCLEETNPVLLETALGQFLKFRRGDPDLLPSVSPLLDHPATEIRLRASRVIGQIVLRYAAGGIAQEGELRSAVAARARRDEVVAVRIAATEALKGFGGRETTEILEQIAARDPDQSVRYMAETILLERRTEGANEEVEGRAIDFQKDAAYDRFTAQQ
jgi:hypothetical protein